MTDTTILTTNVNTLPLKEAALYYAQFARVFPLSPGTKIPLLAGSWTSMATQDPDQITRWWEQHPTANIALVADMNLTILDLDTKHNKDGIKSLRQLVDTKSLIPEDAPIQKTPTGGRHVIFKHPPSYPKPFHNATDKGPTGGIDVRSGNAYIVAAPSRLIDQDLGIPTGGYEMEHGMGYLTELPQELTELLTQWSTAADTVVDISADQPAYDILDYQDYKDFLPTHLQQFAMTGSIVEYGGDRSAALMAVASTLYLRGLTDSQVFNSMIGYPGVMKLANERRENGSLEAQHAWLWKYTCAKARKNRKMTSEEVLETLQPVPEQTIEKTRDLTDLSEVMSIDDLGILRERYLIPALQLPALEQSAVISKIKKHMAKLGVMAKAIDQEVEQIRARLQTEESPRGPIFAFLNDGDRPKAVYDNFKALMNFYKIAIRHNLMSHQAEITIPNELQMLEDTLTNDQRSIIRDLMEKHDMNINRVDEFVSLDASLNAFHPVLDAIEATPWDGVDRITPLLDCMKLPTGSDPFMRDKLVRTWLVSAIAVLNDYGDNPPRGVLILAGPQAIGKTTFFRRLTMAGCFGEGLHLDPHNKDSLKKAVKYHIVELGELDSTFKKSDISALKAFISNTVDEIRLPYEAKESKWRRRTVFAGTVNRVDFLQDYTGNTRFWPVELEDIDLDQMREVLPTGQAVAQLWSQVYGLYKKGVPHVLSQGEMKALEQHNELFREHRYEETLLLSVFDWAQPRNQAMTVTEVVKACGVKGDIRGKNPFTEPLQKLTGQTHGIPTKRNGQQIRAWMMPPLKIMPGLTMLD